MTRRTDHIRATALRLASSGELTVARLGDAVHLGDRQARRWVRLLADEHLIAPHGIETLPGLGRPRRRYHLTDT